MTDAPRPDVERIEGMFLDVSQGGHGFYVHRQDVLSLVAYIRTLEAENATLRRELAAADTSIATLSAGDRYGDGWEAGRDAVVALTRTMQQGFQSRMHEQATFAAIDGALQALIANTEDLEPSND